MNIVIEICYYFEHFKKEIELMPTYITDKKDLAENIRNIRSSLGLTQEAVANYLNLHRTTFAYYEIGKTIPTIFTLLDLADFLNVPVEKFYIKGGGMQQIEVLHEDFLNF